MQRYDYLKAIAPEAGDALAVCTGWGAREWWAVRPGEGNLKTRTLGLVSSIAAGLALALPHRKVIAIDGDGAFLMNLCGLPTIALQNPGNLIHLLFDNEIYEASGGTATASRVTDAVALAQAAGYKLNIIYPDDYGIHFYADTLFTTDDLIARNPDLVRRFVRATLKGWTYAVENPTAIGPMIVKYKPDADAELESEKMTASLPLVNTGEDFIGWMKPEVWAGMEQTLREQGVLTQTVDVTQAYTMQFLEEIYGK